MPMLRRAAVHSVSAFHYSPISTSSGRQRWRFALSRSARPWTARRLPPRPPASLGPSGVPGPVFPPASIRHRPLGIAGARHAVPRRVRAPHRGAAVRSPPGRHSSAGHDFVVPGRRARASSPILIRPPRRRRSPRDAPPRRPGATRAINSDSTRRRPLGRGHLHQRLFGDLVAKELGAAAAGNIEDESPLAKERRRRGEVSPECLRNLAGQSIPHPRLRH